MYVCLCHGVSDKKIISTVHKHQIRTINELRQILPVGSCCGKCVRQARQLIENEQSALYPQISEVA
ncbi:bacterioferritin-associated ferredoxin [Proteus vulgaris]|uniref:bacterioferritin-associated ferredoxin n=1 Tax=Proteus TaxID=583 RepID=UPI0018C4DFB3|nr:MULTISPECIES: bacterioferritin-associated ferredoxin [Proteus]MBG2712451.1 bacterioferritin-associated ferredoxin [Proteus mirabilis]MCF1958010.1 bacterioferritin-associated ferredoxin [Escherichia coli]MBG2769219.1 bacterioferritin-associated ferredoxin [Proteus mirabilis]MBI6545051.1 bacterioferritin-associated ferredoxin [Proteus vulgaris]GLX65608.1 bacterioferritin-associated ferredoxin [Proteus vulgaris]